MFTGGLGRICRELSARGRAGAGRGRVCGESKPGGQESQRQVKVEAAAAVAGRGRGGRGAAGPGWRQPGRWAVGSQSLGADHWRAQAHKEGALGCGAQRRRLRERQGVFGACARLCPGSRVLLAGRAGVLVPTRTDSVGTCRDRSPVLGPVDLARPTHPFPAGARPLRVVGGGWEEIVETPSLPFSARGTHTETGRRRDAKERGFLNAVFKCLTGKQSCSAILISLESCQKS